MSIGATFRNDILRLIYNGDPISGIADNAQSSPATSFYLSLHTANPNAGDQTTDEVNYPGYSRVEVVRDGSGWVVTANSVSPVEDILFPTGTGGSGHATYGAIGLAQTGAGKILDSGVLTTPLPFGVGIAPVIEKTATISRV